MTRLIPLEPAVPALDLSLQRRHYRRFSKTTIFPEIQRSLYHISSQIFGRFPRTLGDMDDIELHHPRDGAFTLMRHAVMSSPSTIRLITHLLVVSTNLLSAFAIALVMVAFGATFLIQCYSVICVIEKFMECFNEVAITMGARVVSLLLMKTCFSRGTVGERERMAVSGALVRVAVGYWWSSFAYSVRGSSVTSVVSHSPLGAPPLSRDNG